MSVIAVPALIALAVLVGVIFTGWLVSSWFQDHYALPIQGDTDPTGASKPELDA